MKTLKEILKLNGLKLVLKDGTIEFVDKIFKMELSKNLVFTGLYIVIDTFNKDKRFIYFNNL